MKTIYRIFTILILFIGCVGFSQTPEQQKRIDEALKMQDSIMNTPEMKAMMKQLNENKKEQDANKKTNSKSSSIPKTTKKVDKYWQNTLASDNNNILKNWKNGVADLVFDYRYDARKDKVESIKVGIIKVNGTIELNPINKVPILKPLNDYKDSNKFFDIHNPDVYQFSNENAGFKLNPYLSVHQNGTKIGTFTVGNSAKVTLNLLTPGDLYYGDEGYILSWVYVDEACSLKANEDFKGDLSNTGTPLIVETNVTYDLSFNPGWNLVKTEVIGTHLFHDAPEEDRSRYKKHRHTIVSSIPEDATYFFRKSPQY